VFALTLNQADITVEGHRNGGVIAAALQSPPTRSTPAPAHLVSAVLALFGYTHDDLDPRIPPALAHGGADHLVLGLKTREALASMKYDLNAGRSLMKREGLVTILLAHAETPRLFHTRNPFASGGVYEDPATGAATAAFAGYLRDIVSYRAKTWACALAYGPKSRHRRAARSASQVPHGSCNLERQTRHQGWKLRSNPRMQRTRSGELRPPARAADAQR
jgi:PhzF family phenazine biosynthesis protein